MVDEDDDEVGWSDLPYSMVELIMNTLMTAADDYIRCGAVCTSWRTIFIYHRHNPPPDPDRVHVTLPPLPVLVVPTPTPKENNNNKKKTKSEKKKKKKKKTKSISFYSIISKKVINQFQVTIPNNWHFRGSSYGWLVAVDNDSQVRLFNPFLSPSTAYIPPSSRFSSSVNIINNNYEILLPSLNHLPYDPNLNPYDPEVPHYCKHDKSPSSYTYLRKAILSADPLSNPIDYIVMVIFGPTAELAFCRPGHNDKTWTSVDSPYDNYYDVIYYYRFFFALHKDGPVVVLDTTRNMMAVTLEIHPHPQSRLMDEHQYHEVVYLVELEGVLLQVLRRIEVGDKDIKRAPYSTIGFQVFHTGKELKWKLMKNLGGHTLFLGDNDSICVRASDYPGCRPNSIYFTDDYLEKYHCRPWNGPHDLGVFNLEDNTIENHYPTDHCTPIWPVPIWIQPSIACSNNS